MSYTAEVIENYRALFVDSKNWNWDDAWDGRIVILCERMRSAGFEVTRIWRKGKIQARYLPTLHRTYTPMQQRNQVFERLLTTALAADIKELTFHGSYFFVHFDMGKPIKRWNGY